MKAFRISLFRHLVLPLSFAVLAAIADAQAPTPYRDLHDFGGTTTVSSGKLGPDGAVPVGRVEFIASADLPVLIGVAI